MKILKKDNIKPVVLGLVVFLGLYVLASALSKFLAVNYKGSFSVVVWLNIFACLTWIVAGYVTGSVSKVSGVLNGGFFGLLSPLIVVPIMFVVDGYNSIVQAFSHYGWLNWIVLGVVLGGIGGLCWDIKQKVHKKAKLP
jgi:hypothetical protein